MVEGFSSDPAAEGRSFWCYESHQALFQFFAMLDPHPFHFVRNAEWDKHERFVGGLCGGGTPGPFPNPAVKPASADGTWTVTSRERRSLPTFLFSSMSSSAFFSLMPQTIQTPKLSVVFTQYLLLIRFTLI